MNILLSGSSGFVGASLLRFLSGKGHKIFVIDRGNFKRAFDTENIKYITELELNHLEENVDILIHAAWGGTRGLERDDLAIQKRNLEFLNRVLLSSKKLAVKTILSFGSQAEYGIVDSAEIDREVRPVSQYGIYKVLAKNLISNYCKENGIRFIWLRLFSLYGIGDYSDSLISMIIRKMLKNEPIDLTECVQFWDYLNISDLLSLVNIFVEDSDLFGEFDVAYGNSKQLREYVEIIKEITISQSLLNYGAIKYPKHGYTNLKVNIDKLTELTKWKPTITFHDGIKGIVNAGFKDLK